MTDPTRLAQQDEWILRRFGTIFMSLSDRLASPFATCSGSTILTRKTKGSPIIRQIASVGLPSVHHQQPHPCSLHYRRSWEEQKKHLVVRASTMKLTFWASSTRNPINPMTPSTTRIRGRSAPMRGKSQTLSRAANRQPKPALPVLIDPPKVLQAPSPLPQTSNPPLHSAPPFATPPILAPTVLVSDTFAYFTC